MEWETKEILMDMANKLDVLLLLFKEADPLKYNKVIEKINKGGEEESKKK